MGRPSELCEVLGLDVPPSVLEVKRWHMETVDTLCSQARVSDASALALNLTWEKSSH